APQLSKAFGARGTSSRCSPPSPTEGARARSSRSRCGRGRARCSGSASSRQVVHSRGQRTAPPFGFPAHRRTSDRIPRSTCPCSGESAAPVRPPHAGPRGGVPQSARRTRSRLRRPPRAAAPRWSDPCRQYRVGTGHGLLFSRCCRCVNRFSCAAGATFPTARVSVALIEARNLSKDYGDKRAVDDLTFTVRPGVVTGFLGPNGSGKSTTIRLMLGLDAPTAGDTKGNGKHYRDHAAPLHEVGALLEARSVHSGRSAYNHLLALAQTHGIPRRRVDDLIDLVGLREVAHKRAGQFSLGMGQRLGIASALLGDPETLILEEPVNGLDPEGIHWIRTLLRSLAAEGRTVFVSSHLMSEM